MLSHATTAASHPSKHTENITIQDNAQQQNSRDLRSENEQAINELDSVSKKHAATPRQNSAKTPHITDLQNINTHVANEHTNSHEPQQHGKQPEIRIPSPTGGNRDEVTRPTSWTGSGNQGRTRVDARTPEGADITSTDTHQEEIGDTRHLKAHDETDNCQDN